MFRLCAYAGLSCSRILSGALSVPASREPGGAGGLGLGERRERCEHGARAAAYACT